MANRCVRLFRRNVKVQAHRPLYIRDFKNIILGSYPLCNVMSVATVVTFVECLWISEYLGWQIQERQRFDQGTFVTFKSFFFLSLSSCPRDF